MTPEENSQNYKSFSYELFILAISILAIINVLTILLTSDPNMDMVLIIVNFALSLILLVDFFYRLFTAPKKVSYFINDFGWLDFLGSLPIFWMPIFRLLRIIRILRLFKQTGAFGLMRDLRHHPASSVLAAVSFLVLLVIQIGSYLVIGAETQSANANIIHPFDALWWALVTVTTVGYGDKFPVTSFGRVIGALVILLGVIMFSVLTSFFTSKFHARVQADSDQLLTTAKKDIQEIHSLLEHQTSALNQIETRLARIEKKLDQETD